MKSARASVTAVALAAALCCSAAARAQQPRAQEVTQIEKQLQVADAELSRVEDQLQRIPDLFTSTAADRARDGALYYALSEHELASVLLFGAVEPLAGETQAQIENQPGYTDSLFFLADSLYLLGNGVAARSYFEKLLRLRGHPHHAIAIMRLMEISADLGRYDDVENYYKEYIASASGPIPGQVRYLHAKALFRAKRDDAALQELQQVAPTDGYSLRSQYLGGAILVRKEKLEDALEAFRKITLQKPIARGDRAVIELAHVARGRLFYELDRLDESIDAYQHVPYDSQNLTTMLYEVSWTYVRRGQNALKGSPDDGLTETQRRARAQVEYNKALDQLDDLRSLEPDSDRAADIEVLQGNLRLQNQEFEAADRLFQRLRDEYQAVDDRLVELTADTSSKERLLQDIIAIGSGGLAVDTPLPPLAARRAVGNADVAKAIAVFKEIRDSREQIAQTQKQLERLDALLSPDNPSRAELFRPLQGVVERSSSLANTLTALKSQAVSVERAMARPSPELQAQLTTLRADRKDVEAKIATLPRTPEETTARRNKLQARVDKATAELHRLELVLRTNKAALVANDFTLQRSRDASETPVSAELKRNRLRELSREVSEQEALAARVREAIEQMKLSLRTLGGRCSDDERLRAAYTQSFTDERALLAAARDPAQAPLYARLDSAVARLDELAARNQRFRDQLDGVVEQRLAGVRGVIASERTALSNYSSAVAEVDQQATALRDTATNRALEEVRRSIGRTVLRADVGLVDASFGRKQKETETIGDLQQVKAAELTDLTQAFADLNKDEVP